MDASGAMSAGARFDRMEAMLERIEQKLDSKVDKAVLEALELEREKRHNEQMHYFNVRLQTVSELAGRVVIREEYNDKHEALEKRLSTIESWRANVAGRTVGVTFVVSVAVATIAAVGGHLIA